MLIKKIILFLLVSSFIYSQELIKDYDIEKDVYFDLDGTWTFEASSIATGDPISLINNLYLGMIPDLNASLWLFNSFFFEAKIKKLSLDNQFTLGYQGNFYGLREFRIGNSDLSIGEYAGYVPSTPIGNYPGLRIKFQTEETVNEALLRYTKRNKQKDIYIGNEKLNINNISYSNFSRGHFFVIPDKTTNFKIIADNNILNLKDFEYHKDKNIIYIPNIYSEIYLISESITKDVLFNFSNPKESPIILNGNIDSNDLWQYLTREINGQVHFLMYKKDILSPFEHLGAYKSSLENAENYIIKADNIIHTNFFILDDFIIIDDGTNDSLLKRLPFLKVYNYIDKESTYNVTLESSVPIKGYFLDENTNTNSVQIYINGIKAKDYSINWDNKEIIFKNKISPLDRVEINYEINNPLGNGNLLLAYGGAFNIIKNLNLELSGIMDWNILEEEFSTADSMESMYIDLNGQLTYKDNFKRLGLKGGLSSLNPDISKGYKLLDLSQNILLDNKSTSLYKVNIINSSANISVLESGDINFMAHCNPLDTDIYKTLYFKIINNGSLTNSSEITIILPGLKSSYSYTIKENFSIGINEFNIPLSSFTKKENSNKIYLNFKNLSSGDYTIESLILQDTNLELNQYGSTDLTITPQDFNPMGVKILSDTEISLYGFLGNNYGVKGLYTGKIFENSIEIGYSKNELQDFFNYTVNIPLIFIPLYVEESLKYSMDIHRKEKIGVSTKTLNSEISLENLITREKLLTSTELKFILIEPLSIDIGLNLKQDYSSNLNLINPIIESYFYLIPQNSNEYNSFWNITSLLEIPIGIYTPKLSYDNSFVQNKNVKNKFYFNNNINLDIFSFDFHIGTSSAIIPNTSDNLTSALYSGFNFDEFNSMTFYTLFLREDNHDYFVYNGDKNLESDLGIKFSLSNKLFLGNILYQHKKIYKTKASLDYIEIDHNISLEKEFPDLLKNTLTLTITEPIFNSDFDVSLTMATIYFKELTPTIEISGSNNLKLSLNDYANIFRLDLKWKGKSGSVLIIPFIDYVANYPYFFKHTESLYLKNETENFTIGLRHSTKLIINSANETEAYIDVIYANKDDIPLSMALGIFTTLIF